MPAIDDATLAYSYTRFSTREQEHGDSLRRQTAAAAAWCKRMGVSLDTSTTLHDGGKSAYTGTHRTNPARHALAAFLRLVELGRVPRGSYLLIENLDRLTREHIQPALLLALNLLQAGIRIVQLKPAEMVFDDKSDTLPVMMMMMELSRGHGESAIKSERIGAAWAQKKKAARETGQVFTRRLPGWIEEKGGKLRVIPGAAATVRRIFALSAAGYGNCAIVKRLTDEGVSCFGGRRVKATVDGQERGRYRAPNGARLGSGKWLRSYVQAILSDRRAIGEYQPRRQGRQPDGPPIPNYFPVVVTEALWHATRAGADKRKRMRGRIGKRINIFGGLVRHARDGDTYFVAPRRGGRHVLINTASAEGRATCYSFPADVFERSLLALMREISPRELLGKDDGPDEVLALAGELGTVEAKIAELEGELRNGDCAPVVRVLRQLEERRAELGGKLAQARQKAASPLSEAWAESHQLLAALDDARDEADARMRLRGAVRRIVDSVWLLVVPKGCWRLAAVQIKFTGGAVRDYLILNRAAGRGRKSECAARSAKWEGRDAKSNAPLDLADPKDAARVEVLLMGMAAKLMGDAAG